MQKVSTTPTKREALLLKPVGRRSVSVEQFSGFERKGSSLVNSGWPVGFPYRQLQIFDKILMEKYATISVPFVLCFYNYARIFFFFLLS